MKLQAPKIFRNSSLSLFLFLASGINSFSKDVEFKVLGIKNELIYSSQAQTKGQSLGQLTDTVLLAALQSKTISEYRGSEGGVSSINHLGSALEIKSDTVMDAYGWCYRVDGMALDLMADELKLTGEESLIEWFYAYGRSDHNVWKSMCVPADHLPNSAL